MVQRIVMHLTQQDDLAFRLPLSLVTEVGRGRCKGCRKKKKRDTKGRASHRHRTAGAREVLVSGGARWALMHELRGAPEPTLDDLLARLSPVDLVLVEGFKTATHAKVEVHREATAEPPIALTNPTVQAVASDRTYDALPCPVLPLSDTAVIADFIAKASGLATATR